MAGLILLAGSFVTDPETAAYDAEVIIEHAGDLAGELHQLAKTNPAVARALRAVLASGQWGGLIAVVGSIAVPIAAAHGLVPPMLGPLMGAEPSPRLRRAHATPAA